eukprot:XP_001704115.1 Hypothetical protein GL50803_106267 [Giardia lamblia ATCC 50803]
MKKTFQYVLMLPTVGNVTPPNHLTGDTSITDVLDKTLPNGCGIIVR